MSREHREERRFWTGKLREDRCYKRVLSKEQCVFSWFRFQPTRTYDLELDGKEEEKYEVNHRGTTDCGEKRGGSEGVTAQEDVNQVIRATKARLWLF